MVQKAAVVEDANGGDQRGAGEDAFDLGARGAIENEEHGNHDGAIHGQAAQKRNGREMNFARAGQVHHADAQSQGAHGHDQ